MFIEPNINPKKLGWIEVICGSMFSGKTEELIRRLKRARIANLKVAIFKPDLDTRYDKAHIVSHDENSIPSTPITDANGILSLAEGMDVVGIDEAQFFDAALPEVFTKYSQIPEHPATLTPDDIAANRDQWLADWTATLLK